MALKLVNVDIEVRGKILFKKFNLKVERGDFCTLMGPSGSGKSSLFNFILGNLNSHDFRYSGEVWLNDVLLNPLPVEKRQMGILFQDPCLFPHLSVKENLAFGMRRKAGQGSWESQKQKLDRIQKTLQQAQISDLKNQNPETLSGGEKTRVALLRTLLSEPQSLLLDEPFSKLDQALRSHFRDWVFTLLKEKSIPVILVTHDPEDIAPECKQIVELAHV